MAYCTKDDLRLYLNVESTSENALLDDCITRAQSMIDTHCKRSFEASADTTRRFDAIRDVNDFTLYLDADLCQITSITNGDSTSVTSGQYVSEPRNQTPYYALRLKSSSGISWTYSTDPENAITITGRWAYSVTAPAAIEQACLRLAAYLYRQRDSSTQDGDRPIMSASGAVLLPSQLPKDITGILNSFVRV